MKLNARLMLIVAITGLAAFYGWSVKGQETPTQNVVWEHAIISSTGDNSARLSQLGAEGWELVTVRSEEKFTGNFRQMEVTYYLKRGKRTAK
jgi:hypothetical protein